jgi:hypothetical protein
LNSILGIAITQMSGSIEVAIAKSIIRACGHLIVGFYNFDAYKPWKKLNVAMRTMARNDKRICDLCESKRDECG